MQRAVQANNFKIPLDQLATYLQFATKRAQETGQSVDYLVDSIVTGLGRQSVMILDNLGISAKEIRDNMKDGSTMAEAVGKIIQKEMGNATTAIDNAEMATSQFSTAWQNMMAAIGSGTGLKNAWNSVLGWMAEKFNKVTEVMEVESVGTGIKLLNILSGGIVGGALIDEEIKKQAIANTPDGPEIPAGVKITRNDGTQATQEEAKAVRGLVGQLEAKIKAKTELRDLSANPTEIDNLNGEIKKLEEELKLLKMTKAERIEYYKSQQTQIDKIEGIYDLDLMRDNLATGKAMLDNAVKDWQAKGSQMAELSLKQQELVSDAATMITNSLVSGIGGSLNELANVIAGVENANVGSVIRALLSPLADACISAGLLIMTTGEGIEALRNSLTTFLGVGAVAAGAALMAVGVAAKAGLAAIGTNSGTRGTGAINTAVTSYAGGYGVNPNNYQQNNNFALTTTLRGQDLLLSIERTQQNNRR
jgi:hypothetical protein